MGFLGGLVSGFTLTSSVLYISVLAVQSHRIRQASLLNQQSLVLNSLVDPSIMPEDDAPRFALQRHSWTETFKDRWNAEIEGGVKKVREIRWNDVRHALEERDMEDPANHWEWSLSAPTALKDIPNKTKRPENDSESLLEDPEVAMTRAWRV